MPIKRPCNRPGCPNLVERGYCHEHKKDAPGSWKHRKHEPTQHIYKTSRWAEVRWLKAQRQPLCERCEAEGRTRLLDVVHHRVPIRDGGASYDIDNLESLCHMHHNQEHARR